MAMTRRRLLALFAGAAALDPERLLWVPGRKTICLPPVRLRPLSLFDPGLQAMISEEAARMLRDRTFFPGFMAHQREWNAQLTLTGETILFSPPPRWKL